MTRRALLIPLALPILFTATTLALVAVNRRAARGPTVLTERDAGLSSLNDDNSAASVRLVWHPVPGTADTWFGREKLRDLGFDTSVDPGSTDAPRHYQRALARDVFVAFELQENPVSVETPDRQPGGPGSRLVPVDVALDAATLASKYPDAATHLIAQGMVRPTLQGGPSSPRFVTGWVMSITPSRIHIPPSLARNLPRRSFTIGVNYGTRWEPWVVEVKGD
jgi:hypothetical protein